jgi:hypothetical protein
MSTINHFIGVLTFLARKITIPSIKEDFDLSRSFLFHSKLQNQFMMGEYPVWLEERTHSRGNL